MLNIQSLTMAYGQRVLWSDVNFTAERGTVVAVTGPSGCGKSTLLNCVGMLVTPTSGTITFEGTDLLNLSTTAERRFRRNELGYLFQNYALIEEATVEANLAVALRAKRLRGRAARDAMHEALNHVGLKGRLSDPIAQLSGGEQQRVALARLLVRAPSLVLADEPTGALDDTNRDNVMRHLRAIAERGAVVLIATHDHTVQKSSDTTLDLTVDTMPRAPIATTAEPSEHPDLSCAHDGTANLIDSFSEVDDPGYRRV